MGKHQGGHRGGGRSGAPSGASRLVASPAVSVAARAGPQADFPPFPEGVHRRNQLQRRARRSVHHRRESAPRSTEPAAPQRDTGGRGLLDASTGRAAASRRDPRRDPGATARWRCAMTAACGLLPVLDQEEDTPSYEMSDYEGARARWCPGCGDHSVLTAVQRLLAAEQLKPEQTVFVSGIGCSSRFPHYLSTYGFHGIHGRALPVATGIRLHRPDLRVFVVMGDGDCTSIGAGHWVHAMRYNLDMVVMLLDNAIYGLTKNQTSPTTPQGFRSNTQPHGSWLPALNPLSDR